MEETSKEYVYMLRLFYEMSQKNENFSQDVKTFWETSTDEYEYIKETEETATALNEWMKQHTAFVDSHVPKKEGSEGKKGKPVRIYVDGCFDIMHSGHYNALRQAKALGDILVAGVVSDEEVTKTKGIPIMKYEERRALVASCKWVDEIAEQAPYSPTLEWLAQNNCDYGAHGDDITPNEHGVDSFDVLRKAGKLRVFKRTEGISTTDIVGRLLTMSKEHHSRARKVSNVDLPAGTNEVLKTVPGTEVEKELDFSHLKKRATFLPSTRRLQQFAPKRAPKETDKIVYIDGAFDLLHAGHIKAMQTARQEGDFLIVGVHDDETINDHKGSNYPIISLNERCLQVLAHSCVDEVIIGAPWEVTEQLIRALKINLVISGNAGKEDAEETKKEETRVDPYAYPKSKGIFKEVESGSDLHTEGIISRVVENRMKYLKRMDRGIASLERYYNQQSSVKEI
eukprot:CAMPEP_0115021518 /NCGR_PEP_ID=MMETSP0216-20121206/30942_1 /TAXON_ID=223996 /ORGANISM="Protocruzia adherens, Strain Boccale" /LENGTH=453 /DNA_ID=CAMNT_0002393905 /DNA_START=117 /DNA_END=1478 /DNA_ORIENTATION=+